MVLILAYTLVTTTTAWTLLPTVTLPDAENAYVLGPWNEDGTRFMTAADDIYYHTDPTATGTFTTTSSPLMDDIVDFGFGGDISAALNNKTNFHVHSFLTYRGDDTCFGIGIDFNDNLNVTYHTVLFVLNGTIKEHERLLPNNTTHPPPLDYAAAITQNYTDVKVYKQSGWNVWGSPTQIPVGNIELDMHGYKNYVVSSADGSTLAAIQDGDAIVGSPNDIIPYNVQEYTNHDFISVALNSDGSRLIAATGNSILVYKQTITTIGGQSTTNYTITHRHSTIYTYNSLYLQQCSFSVNETVIACLATVYDPTYDGIFASPYDGNCVAVFTLTENIDSFVIVLSAAITFSLDLDMYSNLDKTNPELFLPETPTTIKINPVDANGLLEFTDVSVYLKSKTGNATNLEGSIIAATYIDYRSTKFTKVALMKNSASVPPSPPPSPSPPSKSSGSSAGMIVGITIGAVALIGGVGYFIYSTSARRSQSAKTLLLYM